MGKPHRTFTWVFKFPTVELIESSDEPLAQIARELGIVETMRRRWVQQFSEQGTEAFPGKWIEDFRLKPWADRFLMLRSALYGDGNENADRDDLSASQEMYKAVPHRQSGRKTVSA